MTATLPTGWQGRLLALGLLLLVLVAVYALAAVPLLDFYAERAATAEIHRALLVKLNAVAAELPALRGRVGAQRSAVDSNKLTLEGASDAIASAALQGHIEELAGAAGVTIGSTEGLPAETQGSYRRLGLRLALTGRYESLMKLLAALETATPPLVTDNLQIHSLQRQLGAPVTTLDVNLEVYGFRVDQSAAATKP